MSMIESKDRATSDPRPARWEQMDRGVEYVLFWFTDIEGHLKSFAITPSEMRARSTTAWASTVRRSPASTRSRTDMVAIPDPATYRMMPTRDRRRRSVA